MTEIKICGIRTLTDVRLLQEYGVEYAGFVMFYPKSLRNIDPLSVKPLLDAVGSSMKKTAVVVSPGLNEIRQIEQMGFDMIQIHGHLTEEVLMECSLPVFQAFHVEEDGWDSASIMNHCSNHAAGYLFDGKSPGRGEVFDWNVLKDFDRMGKKLILAGGLNAGNVADGIHALNPDIVDVCSSVENTDGHGKDAAKVEAFINAVRRAKGAQNNKWRKPILN